MPASSLSSLQKHLERTEQTLTQSANRTEAYRAFLKRELERTAKRIEELKLRGGGKR
jgi:uncharacterized protein Yka (UPF0111/DUF47 family)